MRGREEEGEEERRVQAKDHGGILNRADGPEDYSGKCDM